jgi:hypothetical protein
MNEEECPLIKFIRRINVANYEAHKVKIIITNREERKVTAIVCYSI